MRLTTRSCPIWPTAAPASSRRPGASTSPTSAPVARCSPCCCSRRPGRAGVHPDQLPALGRRHPGPDRASARTAGHRRRRYRDMIGSARQNLVLDSEEFWPPPGPPNRRGVPDPDAVGVVLFTSGTTSRAQGRRTDPQQPDGYVTRHGEFNAAEPTDAALICVPPYHIAGVSAALSTCTRAERWCTCQLRRERVGPAGQRRRPSPRPPSYPPCWTASSGARRRPHRGPRLPSLRNLAYGGSRSDCHWCAGRWELLPDVGFVNAYGLTETSSTIAVLGGRSPTAHGHADENVARRLGSVGQPVAGSSADPRRGRQRARPR